MICMKCELNGTYLNLVYTVREYTDDVSELHWMWCVKMFCVDHKIQPNVASKLVADFKVWMLHGLVLK